MHPDTGIAGPADVTDDAVLGGRLRLLQPRRGHRVGHDAILLAAATTVAAEGTAVDLGAGVGAAGLALAVRNPQARLRLVEIDPSLAALAADNIVRNGLADRAAVDILDVEGDAAAFAAAGLGSGCADAVLMNPPFNDPTRSVASPDPGRRAAHMGDARGLARWLATAARLLAPAGRLTLIHRADAGNEVVAALGPGFGAVTVLPVLPRPDAAAIRIIVRAVKNARAAVAVLPPLVLQDADGRPSAAAEAVLRAGRALSTTPEP